MEIAFIVAMGIVIGIIAIFSIISMVLDRGTSKEEIKELRREMDDLKSKVGSREK